MTVNPFQAPLALPPLFPNAWCGEKWRGSPLYLHSLLAEPKCCASHGNPPPRSSWFIRGSYSSSPQVPTLWDTQQRRSRWVPSKAEGDPPGTITMERLRGVCAVSPGALGSLHPPARGPTTGSCVFPSQEGRVWAWGEQKADPTISPKQEHSCPTSPPATKVHLAPCKDESTVHSDEKWGGPVWVPPALQRWPKSVSGGRAARWSVFREGPGGQAQTL